MNLSYIIVTQSKERKKNMKFKKLVKCCLAVILILGSVSAVSACNKEETIEYNTFKLHKAIHITPHVREECGSLSNPNNNTCELFSKLSYRYIPATNNIVREDNTNASAYFDSSSNHYEEIENVLLTPFQPKYEFVGGHLYEVDVNQQGQKIYSKIDSWTYNYYEGYMEISFDVIDYDSTYSLTFRAHVL